MKNPHEDDNGQIKPGETFEWMEWRSEHGDTSLDGLSESERQRELKYRQSLQTRMDAEQGVS